MSTQRLGMKAYHRISRALRSAYCISMPRKGTVERLMSTNKLNIEDVVQGIRQRFQDESLKCQQNAWDKRWKDGNTPWNIGKATPVLLLELEQYWDDRGLNNEGFDFYKSNEATSQGVFRTLVPGCGAGYDLVALAQHHDQWLTRSAQKRQNGDLQPRTALVVGLDISDTSLADHASPCVKQALQASPVSWTRVDLIHGDFFKNSDDKGVDDDRWSTLYSYGRQGDDSGGVSADSTTDDAKKFDFIFDYTFFCALPPSLRAAWGAKMASLLKPDTGRLLTIVFPILPDSDLEASTAAGPPFPVTVDEYRKVLEPHGVFIRNDYGGPRVSPATVSARSGKELVCWWSHGSKTEVKEVSSL